MISKKNIFRFTWDEWKWIAIIVMLGVVMYWTALVIEPTYQLLQEASDTQEAIEDRATQANKQNALIIENQNNNTDRLEELIYQHNQIEGKQTILIEDIANATEKLEQIGRILLIQEHSVNETFVDMLIEKEMRKFIENMRENLTKLNSTLRFLYCFIYYV